MHMMKVVGYEMQVLRVCLLWYAVELFELIRHERSISNSSSSASVFQSGLCSLCVRLLYVTSSACAE